MVTALTLLISGVILMFIEALLPGAIAGILGALCLIAGVAYSYSVSAFFGNVILLVTVIWVTTSVFLWMKFFPGSRLGQKLASQSHIGGLNVEQQDLMHRTGKAYTVLRPSGTALINGKKVDVVTEGSMIEPDDPIQVVQVEGMRVVVRKLDPEPPA